MNRMLNMVLLAVGVLVLIPAIMGGGWYIAAIFLAALGLVKLLQFGAREYWDLKKQRDMGKNADGRAGERVRNLSNSDRWDRER